MERRSENESSDMVAKILYMGEFDLSDGTALTIKSNLDFLASLKSQPDPAATDALFAGSRKNVEDPEQQHSLASPSNSSASSASSPSAHEQDSPAQANQSLDPSREVEVDEGPSMLRPFP